MSNSDPAVSDNFELKITELLAQGLIYYEQAKKLDNIAANKASECFSKVIEIDPDNPKAHAFLAGSTILAGASGSPLLAFKIINKGIEDIDAANRRWPENIFVRIVRAFTGYKLPSMFQRRQIAQKDFEYIITATQSKCEQVDTNTLQLSCIYLAQCYVDGGRIKDARSCLTTLEGQPIESAIEEELRKARRRIDVSK